MKKCISALLVAAAVLALSACGGILPELTGETGANGASAPAPSSSLPQSSALAESVVHGVIEDATMNTLMMKTDDGQTLSFATEDADKSEAQGLSIGSEVNVYYTGQIEGGETTATHVVRIESTAASQSAVSSSSVYIGEDAAKAIAAEQVAGASVENVFLSFDYDNGVPAYEGSLIHEDKEYEFEINAIDGSILEWDVEPRGDD